MDTEATTRGTYRSGYSTMKTTTMIGVGYQSICRLNARWIGSCLAYQSIRQMVQCLTGYQ